MISHEQHVTPVLTEEKYKKLNGRSKKDKIYLFPEHGPKQIEPNTLYWDWANYERSYYEEGSFKEKITRKRKQVKFVLLPKALSPAAWLKATMAARDVKEQMRKGTRAADGQVYGGKLTLGWLPQLPGHAKKSKYDNVRTEPTLTFPKLLAALFPLLREMDHLVADNLPEYYNYALKCALNAQHSGDEDDLNRISNRQDYNTVSALDPWGMLYTIRGTAFSTVEFNHNIIFKAHEDGHNVDGTCVCITTLDNFAGGRLVFPRYGYSAELGPMDLLICDNNHELHGNLGPIVGDRYSVVAFLHERVMGREPEPI